MGFLDDFKKGAKDLGTAALNQAKVQYSAAKAEADRRRLVMDTKRKILDRFEFNDLKKICRDYGIGEPSPYETDFDGKKRKITLTRSHYADYVINRLKLDQIKNFADKNKIKIWDIVKDYENVSAVNVTVVEGASAQEPVEETKPSETKVTSIEIKRQDEFDAILDDIENNFEPEDVRDENEFEKQLFQFLKIKYPDRVDRQISTPQGKIDIVIDNKYAVELKIADGKGTLSGLVGQLVRYKKIYKNLATILLDVGKMSRSEMKEYITDYENLGVKVKIVEGILKKRKGSSKQINIKF
jgi:hypothetical protein